MTPHKPGETVDPDICRNVFRRLLPVYTETYADVTWPLMVASDSDAVESRLKLRRQQFLRLARYARVGSPDPFLGWGDVELSQINMLVDELYDVLSSEGMLTKMNENS